jgi:ABC-type antimicrobial peptide transport system permease subunit
MIKNYFKIALRNLSKNKASSFINIGGLAVGMAVAILIALWIYDEVSFNKSFKNHDRIAQIMQRFTINGETGAGTTVPFPMGDALRKSFGNDFKHISMSSWNGGHILSSGGKILTKSGTFFEPDILDMLSVKMLKGSKDALNEPSSIIISSSTAKAYFGTAEPMEKIMKIDDLLTVKVTGVYEDFPSSSSFSDVSFISPWKLFAEDQGFKNATDPWRCNCYLGYVQVADNTDMNKISAKIKDIKLDKVDKSELTQHPQVFLNPMSRWHLFSEFKNGISAGGRIQYVWLFGTIGLFVLLLACINFMNLSTARSEKRAKEVGIRKSIGSLRSQLITQFFSESLLIALFSFILSLLLVQLILPFFNEVAGKKMAIPWGSPVFWIACTGFSFITGLIAGSYPAFYLSSFEPVKVLKGTFRAGRFAAIPRKVLVVVQFTVSVILIIGTIIVFRQIQFAKDRPIGYSRDGLVMMEVRTGEIHKHFDAVRSELLQSGAVTQLSESGSPVTAIWSTNAGFDWKGKDPNLAVDFPNIDVSYDYGKTVGFQFKDGRDFSRDFATDSTAFIVNEAAIKFMGLKNPVGETLKWDGVPFTIIGVVKDMVIESPYTTIRPTLYHLSKDIGNVLTIKLNPEASASTSLAKIESVFKKYNPSQPFEYQFIDEQYARKFENEQRIGKLASFFAFLAIFISCLGLFGMASFVAEQRTKEIGVRKVLGASVFNLWKLLSKEFVLMVLLSCAIAIPVAYYFLGKWLLNYEYRTKISWWIFGISVAGALVITLLTVSFQAIRAAVANPVKSLRTE